MAKYRYRRRTQRFAAGTMIDSKGQDKSLFLYEDDTEEMEWEDESAVKQKPVKRRSRINKWLLSTVTGVILINLTSNFLFAGATEKTTAFWAAAWRYMAQGLDTIHVAILSLLQ